jgi:hypothetical protein
MTRIADDFDAIRARLAELRGETPSGGALEFNADELIIISDVSVPLSSLRIEATLDAAAYKRGAEEVAAANRRLEEEAFRPTPALLAGIAQFRALYPVEPKRRVTVNRDAIYDSGWVDCTGWAAIEAAEEKRSVSLSEPLQPLAQALQPVLFGECINVSEEYKQAPVRRVPVYRDGPNGEPELVGHEEWSEEDIRRYWREAVQNAETKFERGLRTLNEALARGAIATARHNELVALMQERFGVAPVSFTTDDIQPGDELVSDFEKIEGRYWQRTIKLIRNGEVVGISRTHGKPIDLNVPAPR